MSSTEMLIEQYGLIAVFLGGLVEGETVLILAAVAAHHGLLSLPVVFAVAAGAAALGDQGWFLLARFKAGHPLVRRMMGGAAARRAIALVERHPTLFVLGFRFIYGLRIAWAIACGLSSIPTLRFMALNLVAALAWTAALLALGYAFGSAVEALLGDIARLEWKLLAAVAVIGLGTLALHRLLRR